MSRVMVMARCHHPTHLLFQGVDPQLTPFLLLPDHFHLVGEAANLFAVNLPLSTVVAAHL